MSPIRILLAIVAFFLAGAAGAHEGHDRELGGHFTVLNRNVPGCGILFLGSPATFGADGREGGIPIVVPCIEMAEAKDEASGKSAPLEPHTRYRIVVSPASPEHLETPAASPGLLYFVEAEVVETQRAGHPPQPR